ncbi:hypothetical protein K7X08_010043 [Anisodus acutangulus]|uniref:Uncharacterized protein n=1 Tax=Anisodus acutangulus TaxID=402998 RepID=A0A9Q1RU54_9SOLA|nr:hypothetical protein K7X08_010043 [Anisodus acutangulus]
MENEPAKKKTSWSTWEELLLAFAVKRHGLKDWESVAMELQTRSTLPAQLTPQICKYKYRDLRRRFTNNYNNNGYGETINEEEDDVDGDGQVTIPWIEELRQLRVAELKQEVQRYDLSIQSLQLKVKKMEEERENSLNDGEKPDLEDMKEERSKNDKNRGADDKPAESTGKAVSSEETRSFNESNSTENRETGLKNEPEPVEIEPVQEVKPVSEEEEVSYNDSSSDRQEEKKASESKQETKENSDVQSTATLTKRKRQRGGGDGGRSGGDAVEMGVGIKGEGVVKSEPLIEFLGIIRSNKRGSVFKRRLDSQKTDKYKNMIRRHMDLETVQGRIDDGSYCSCTRKFYLDLLLIFNNAIVYFPKSSPESIAANELRGIVMEELKKTRTQSKHPSPGPLRIQPKPELERSDSLLAKHKSTVPLVVCRKRSSISAKAAGSGNNKPEKQADNKPPLNPKPPIKSSSYEEESSIKLGMKEKPVTGVRSMRRSSKGRPNNSASPSNNNQNTNTKQTNSNADKKEEAKPEKKKEEGKKRGAAADFLKRIKKNSPTKGTLVKALKNNPTEDVVKGNKREQQKTKVDERKEAPVRQNGNDDGGGGKEEGSPSKRSVGRPPKRGGRKVVGQEKRVRENSEKDDSSKRPKKRSRR